MASTEENISHAIYIATLIRRRHEKEDLSSDEQKAVEEWQAIHDPDQTLLDELQDRKATTARLRELNAYDANNAVGEIFHQLGIAVPSKVRRLNSLLRWSAAAAVILAFSTLALRYIQGDSPTGHTLATSRTALPPGGNKATLTLADGSTIVLDSAHNGLLTLQGKTNIVKADGQLTYEGVSTKEILYNSISTPRGGQYAVTLADGTKIWLNAASSLKYPTSFSGTTRQVELMGEAYFEVAGDKSKPFTVRLNGMEVQVLGTSFNIKAYQDDASIRTTLVDGAVRLSAHAGEQALLKPGQQGLWSQQQPHFLVRQVNTNNEIAWRNGYFAFDNANIRDIMKDISRWYNVDIEFQNSSIEKNFGGTVSRYQNAQDVLEILESTGSVHFKIKDKKIIVMP